MKILISIDALRRWRKSISEKIVFVPTMGALHDGHVALIQYARRRAGKTGKVVVSIFVNPTQFGNGEDFSVYPRQKKEDAALCRSLKVDALFYPSTEQLYAKDHSIYIEETSTITSGLCGKSRPGHFRGVCTIVAKLFNLVLPHEAIFGAKDFQQVAVIKRMVRDLNFSVKILSIPTIRTSDGLALSSRNQYLSTEERAEAPRIYQALQDAREKFFMGDQRASSLIAFVRKNLPKRSWVRVDYIELVDEETLLPMREATPSSVLAIAVFFGKTRLIDHIEFSE